jgi:peptide/nickel transport system permease protein
MENALHLAVWPGLALSIVVYGINMFGDAIRDLLDPRLRGGLGRYSGKTKKLPKQIAKRLKAEESQ